MCSKYTSVLTFSCYPLYTVKRNNVPMNDQRWIREKLRTLDPERVAQMIVTATSGDVDFSDALSLVSKLDSEELMANRQRVNTITMKDMKMSAAVASTGIYQHSIDEGQLIKKYSNVLSKGDIHDIAMASRDMQAVNVIPHIQNILPPAQELNKIRYNEMHLHPKVQQAVQRASQIGMPIGSPAGVANVYITIDKLRRKLTQAPRKAFGGSIPVRNNAGNDAYAQKVFTDTLMRIRNKKIKDEKRFKEQLASELKMQATRVSSGRKLTYGNISNALYLKRLAMGQGRVLQRGGSTKRFAGGNPIKYGASPNTNEILSRSMLINDKTRGLPKYKQSLSDLAAIERMGGSSGMLSSTDVQERLKALLRTPVDKRKMGGSIRRFAGGNQTKFNPMRTVYLEDKLKDIPVIKHGSNPVFRQSVNPRDIPQVSSSFINDINQFILKELVQKKQNKRASGGCIPHFDGGNPVKSDLTLRILKWINHCLIRNMKLQN